MNRKEIIVVHPKTDTEVSVLKAFMKALNIKFEINKEQPYQQEFVEKIKESRKQAKEGKTTRVKKENLTEFLGLE